MNVSASPAPKQPLKAHLAEIRNYAFIVAAVVIIFSLIGYVCRDPIIAILLKPLEGHQLSYLTVGGGFQFIFQITIWCGLAAALPVVLICLYRFVSPALPERARGKGIVVLASAIALMASGVLFGYFVAIPGAIRFLLSFADEYVQSLLTADSYLNFMFAYTLGLGVLFLTPLLLVFINWIKPLRPGGLLKFERWVIVLAFVLAAIITPTPDPANQLIVALPIILMYQLGFFIVIWINWRTKRNQLHLNKKMPVSTTLPAVRTGRAVSNQAELTLSSQSHTASTNANPRTSTVRRSIDGISVM